MTTVILVVIAVIFLSPFAFLVGCYVSGVRERKRIESIIRRANGPDSNW